MEILMQTVSVVLDELVSPPAWKVVVGDMEMRFHSASEAEHYANTLQGRLDAPHELPAREAYADEVMR
jgi:hypothetical protein